MATGSQLRHAITLLAAAMLATGCGSSNASSDTAPRTTSAGGQQAADGAWEQVKSRGEMVVGLCAEYPPFESRDNAGSPQGFDVDLAHAIGEQQGVRVKIVDTAWEGLLGGVNKGDYDVLITAMSKEEASADNVSVSEPYYELPEVVMVRSGDTSIRSTEDLAGKVVGAQSASSAEKAVDRLTGLKDVKRY